MALVLIETPDATQAFEFYGSVTGDVSYDTSLKKSGLASWKCDSGGSNAAAFVQVSDVVSNPDRLSIWVRFVDLPTNTTRFLRTNGGVQNASIAITSGGVLQVHDRNDNQVGSDGSTLSAGVWYELTVATDGTNSDLNLTLYLNKVLDITVDNILTGTGPDDWEIGWTEAPGGNNEVMNFQHVYLDDVTDESDTGDVRVTIKLPTETGGLDGWDGSNGTIADRPIDNSTFRSHTGTDDQVDSSDIQAAGVGDVDITGETLLGHLGWVWADRGNGGSGSPSILVSDAETLITLLAGTEVMYTKVITSSGYPSGTNQIGMHSTNAGADTLWYEGGVMIAYIASEVAVDTPVRPTILNQAIQRAAVY